MLLVALAAVNAAPVGEERLGPQPSDHHEEPTQPKHKRNAGDGEGDPITK